MPPLGTLRTCIVIPVHDRKRLTLQCLDCLRWCADDSTWKIILVDDGSTDGTGEAVATLHPHVEIVKGDGKRFWTGAMQLGMARALEMGATEIVWLNDDTFPDEASLRRTEDLVRRNPTWMIASTALLEGTPQASCSLHRRGVIPERGALLDADVLAGYQVAFSADVVRKIGLPDARRWPHYGGDSSFTRTAHNVGFQLKVDGDSFIVLNEAPPRHDVADAFWKHDESLSARMQRTFFSTSSRYRLRSLWHLDRLYRGIFGAMAVFPARLAVMAWKIILHPRSRLLSATHPEVTA